MEEVTYVQLAMPPRPPTGDNATPGFGSSVQRGGGSGSRPQSGGNNDARATSLTRGGTDGRTGGGSTEVAKRPSTARAATRGSTLRSRGAQFRPRPSTADKTRGAKAADSSKAEAGGTMSVTDQPPTTPRQRFFSEVVEGAQGDSTRTPTVVSPKPSAGGGSSNLALTTPLEIGVLSDDQRAQLSSAVKINASKGGAYGCSIPRLSSSCGGGGSRSSPRGASALSRSCRTGASSPGRGDVSAAVARFQRETYVNSSLDFVLTHCAATNAPVRLVNSVDHPEERVRFVEDGDAVGATNPVGAPSPRQHTTSTSLFGATPNDSASARYRRLLALRHRIPVNASIRSPRNPTVPTFRGRFDVGRDEADHDKAVHLIVGAPSAVQAAERHAGPSPVKAGGTTKRQPKLVRPSHTQEDVRQRRELVEQERYEAWEELQRTKEYRQQRMDWYKKSWKPPPEPRNVPAKWCLKKA